MNEVTLAIIKPDAVQKRAVGRILDLAYQEAGLYPVALQMAGFDEPFWHGFYEEHRDKPFFEDLCSFMASGPCVFAALMGADAVARWRKLVGATDPAKAAPGTLRALYGTSGPANAVHGSASLDDAARELKFVAAFLSPDRYFHL